MLRHCSDIVVMPRLKLIKGTTHGGMEDHAWYRFDINHTAGPVLHNNRGKGEAIAPQRSQNLRTVPQTLPATAINIAVLLAGMQAAALIAGGLA